MRLRDLVPLTAVALSATLTTVLSAQDWSIEAVHKGEPRAVLVRGDQVLVVGAQPPPTDKMKSFGLPPAGAAWLRPEPRVRMVTSRSRTQLGKVTIVGGNVPRSRYEPADRRWTIEAVGQPAFFISDNAATVVVAHLDTHNRGETEVAIHGATGGLLGRMRRPEIRRVHLSSNGGVVVLAGEARTFVLEVRDGAVRSIGELPPSPATELSPRGDWIARATEQGIAIHPLSDGRFNAEPIATLATGIPVAMQFDDMSTHVVVADNGRVRLFELEGRKELWSVPTGDRTTVTSIDVAGAASFVGVATITVTRRETRSGPGEVEGDVRMLRRDGTMEIRQAIPGGGLSAQAPLVTFFADDRKLLIETRTNVFTLSR